MRKQLLLLATVACFATASADNISNVKKQLNANYSAISDAFSKNQVDKMGAFLTYDFVAIVEGGQKQTKSQILNQFKSFARQLHNTKWVRTIKSLNITSSSAVATVQGNLSSEFSDAEGKDHKMTRTTTSKDTWIKSGKRYKLHKSEVLKNSILMDGKAFPSGR